ncbi:hypothetical protein CNY89_28375, partial [Amaricoccus sp. HAR-UPW-R2A-40]
MRGGWTETLVGLGPSHSISVRRWARGEVESAAQQREPRRDRVERAEDAGRIGLVLARRLDGDLGRLGPVPLDLR